MIRKCQIVFWHSQTATCFTHFMLWAAEIFNKLSVILNTLHANQLCRFRSIVKAWEVHTHRDTNVRQYGRSELKALFLGAAASLRSDWVIQWWRSGNSTEHEQNWFVCGSQILAGSLLFYDTDSSTSFPVICRQHRCHLSNISCLLITSASYYIILCSTHPCPDGAIKYRQQWTLLSGMDLRLTLDSAFRKSSHLLSM